MIDKVDKIREEATAATCEYNRVRIQQLMANAALKILLFHWGSVSLGRSKQCDRKWPQWQTGSRGAAGLLWRLTTHSRIAHCLRERYTSESTQIGSGLSRFSVPFGSSVGPVNTLLHFLLSVFEFQTVYETGNPEYPDDYYSMEIKFDFFNYAGIHRSVVLYTVPTIHISDLTFVTQNIR